MLACASILVWAIVLGGIMANLSVRHLDTHAYNQLRARAAKHGVSMEEEARQIIYLAVSAPEKISQVFQKHFGRKNGINLEASERNKPHEPMELNP
jgi:plasmid stability protein